MKFKKTILVFSATSTSLVAPLFSVVSCGVGGSRAQFMNYQDYMGEDSKSVINSAYALTEFADLPEIGTAIDNKKIVGAVGSDYYNVQLAQDGKIKLLDFNRIFDGITIDGKTFSKDKPLGTADLRSAVKSLYTAQAWDLMDSFKNQMTKNATGHELWEYMVPYFIQQKVVAINPFKVKANAGHEQELTTLKGFDYDAIKSLFGDLSYKTIFTKLHEIGFKQMTLNDYMRDNLAIGTESDAWKNSEFKSKGFTMETDENESKVQITGLQEVLKTFAGKIITESSGLESAQTIHPRSMDAKRKTNSDVAIIYNGDSLDVYQGADNITSEPESENNAKIRVITPKNSTYLLDGVVVPSYVNGSAFNDVCDIIRNAFFKNANYIKDGDSADSIKNNMAYNNFDFVNYTTPFKDIYENVSSTKDYISDYEISSDGKTAPSSGEYAKKAIFNITGTVDANHLTTPIGQDLTNAITTNYMSQIVNNDNIVKNPKS